jgi:hypothetical protein
MAHLLDEIVRQLPIILPLIGFSIGFYWIHRIASDIENN